MICSCYQCSLMNPTHARRGHGQVLTNRNTGHSLFHCYSKPHYMIPPTNQGKHPYSPDPFSLERAWGLSRNETKTNVLKVQMAHYLELYRNNEDSFVDNLMLGVQLADVSTRCSSHPQGKSEARCEIDGNL